MNNATYEVWIRDPNTGLLKAMISDWVDLQFRPTVNNYAGCSIKLHQDSPNVARIDFMDHLEIVRKLVNPLATKNNAVNLVVNPGFEQLGAGGADVWDNWTETVGAGAIADETSSVKSGYHAAKLTRGASDNTKIEQTIAVGASTVHTLTFWSRGDGTYQGRYGVYDATNSADIIATTATGEVGTAYVKVTATITVPATCTSIKLYFYPPSTNTGVAYFDDVRIGPTTVNVTNTQTFGHVVLSKDRSVEASGKGGEYITINGLSYIAYLASRIILPPTAADSSGAITMTAVDTESTFDASGSTTLYNGDKVIPAVTTAQARVVNATVTGTSFSTTEAFTGAVTTEAFTILRAHLTYSKKTDNLMKQLVRDCFVTATDTSRNWTLMTVIADTSESAVTLNWSIRYKGLLDELRSISDSGDCDFDVVWNTTSNKIEFTTYYPQLGSDRREGNADGNVPVIFSMERDNIRGQRWWKSALQMIENGGNALYVAGAGDGANRAIKTIWSGASMLDWNRWEKFIDARDAQTSTELTDRANAKIDELTKVSTGIHFEALSSEACQWGLHYNLGDLITVKAWNEDLTLNDQIVAIEVKVDANGNESVFPVVGSEYPNFNMRYTKLRKNIDQISTAD